MSEGRIEILQGAPTPAEVAAAVVALTPVAARPSVDGGATRNPRSTPAWTRAALLEGVGGAVALRPADLARHPN